MRDMTLGLVDVFMSSNRLIDAVEMQLLANLKVFDGDSSNYWELAQFRNTAI